MSSKELKVMLKSREPVEYFSRVAQAGGKWVEMAYITAVITRFSIETGKYILQVEALDKNERAVYVDKPERFRRV